LTEDCNHPRVSSATTRDKYHIFSRPAAASCRVMDQSMLLRKLNDGAASIQLPKHSILFHAGDFAEGVYLVRSGKVALRWETGSEASLTESIGSGEIVGLAAASNGVYRATAHIAEDADLGYVSGNTLHRLIATSPAISDAIADHIAHKLHCSRTIHPHAHQDL
jgi:CRP-like cAMP-binding protein